MDSGGDAGPVSLGEVQACPAPRQAPSWTDRAAEWGLQGPPSATDHNDGGGAMLADPDGDGDLDLVLTFAKTPVHLYRNDGGAFVGDWLDADPWTTLLLDVNGDGADDLVGAGAHWSWMLAQNGSWAASEPAWAATAPLPEGMTVKEFAPGDADGDGDIDLMVVTIAAGAGPSVTVDPALQTDFLLLQEDGGWTRGPALDAESAARAGFAGTWLDADEDGRLDAYVSNDHGYTYGGNVLWMNREGGFEPADLECFCEARGESMGVTVADVDRDGHEDLVISATARNKLLRGLGDGTFVDVSEVANVNRLQEPREMGWGAAVADLDNDGLSDLLFANGDSYALTEEDPYTFDGWTDVLVQHADGTFTDMREAWGFPSGPSFRGVLPRDVNGDGVLDVLVTVVDGAPRWMVSDGCTAGNWLDVDAPEGSWIEVEAGGVRWVGRATSDLGYAVSAPPRLHVGLGETARVDRLTVRLADGTELSAEDFDARRVVTVSAGPPAR